MAVATAKAAGNEVLVVNLIFGFISNHSYVWLSKVDVGCLPTGSMAPNDATGSLTPFPASTQCARSDPIGAKT